VVTTADVERLALALPRVTRDGNAYRMDGKLLAWPWLERVDPKKPRLPNPEVLVVRVADEARKFELVATEPELFFTEPHYNGYAAVCIRLPLASVDRLDALLREGYDARQARSRKRRAT